MNRDGQMYQILLTEYPQFANRFKSVAFGDGMPASAKWVREGILAKYAKAGTPKKAAAAKTASKAKAVSGSKKAATKKPAAKKPVAKSKSSVKSKRK